MSRKLVLKARDIDEESNIPRWHDYYVLSRFFDASAKGKSFSSNAVMMSIARKIRLAREDPKLEFGKVVESDGRRIRSIPDIIVNLKNSEASLLCKLLVKSDISFYGSLYQTGDQVKPIDYALPPTDLLSVMVYDIVEQLGGEMPSGDDDDDDDDLDV